MGNGIPYRKDRKGLDVEEQAVRLNKYLSEAGVCSRREADRRIEAGEVYVDGQKAAVGQRVRPSQEIILDGKKVCANEEKILLLFHKPPGIVVTDERREKNNLTDYLKYPKRVFAVGRLDKDSRGLLLLTNQGDLVNGIMRSRNFHEKEYEVRIREEVTEDFVRRMADGVYLPKLQVTTRRCSVKKKTKHTFSIVLTQGLNRQIRRMCGQLGTTVVDLKRVRIMHFLLDGIAEGAYRSATKEEWEKLYSAIDGECQ